MIESVFASKLQNLIKQALLFVNKKKQKNFIYCGLRRCWGIRPHENDFSKLAAGVPICKV
jgi:hypothetical protein